MLHQMKLVFHVFLLFVDGDVIISHAVILDSTVLHTKIWTDNTILLQ
jgi:hypothetical protein